jgi:transketolase
VAEVHTLRPLDSDAIAELVRRTGAVVTVEDHNILNGLGSAVAEVIAEEGLGASLVRVGLRDLFPESGEAESLLDAYGMGIGDIVAAARRVLDRARAH